MPIFINVFIFISLESHFMIADLKYNLTVGCRVHLTKKNSHKHNKSLLFPVLPLVPTSQNRDKNNPSAKAICVQEISLI